MNDIQILTIALSVVLPVSALLLGNSRRSRNDLVAELSARVDCVEGQLDAILKTTGRKDS